MIVTASEPSPPLLPEQQEFHRHLRALAGLFESSFLPLPAQGKRENVGDTPRPAYGRLPLGTLPRSTFENPCVPWLGLFLFIDSLWYNKKRSRTLPVFSQVRIY